MRRIRVKYWNEKQEVIWEGMSEPVLPRVGDSVSLLNLNKDGEKIFMGVVEHVVWTIDCMKTGSDVSLAEPNRVLIYCKEKGSE